MDPPTWRAELLGDRPGERDHVVVCLAEQLGRSVGVHRRAADGGHIRFGDHPQLRPRLADGDLHLEPELHAVLVRPDAPHLRPRIPRYHSTQPPMSRLKCFPSKRIISAAAYTASRWSPTTQSTRPPAVTTRPPPSRRVPA